MTETADLSSVIKQLRLERKLTQVQFAAELGLSPATIYRYESGARPDTDALLLLLQFATKYDLSAISNALRKIISERGLAVPRDATSVSSSHTQTLFEAMFGSSIRAFGDEDKARVLAFVAFLKGNTDQTAGKIVDLLLQPWTQTKKDSLRQGKHKERSSNPPQKSST